MKGIMMAGEDNTNDTANQCDASHFVGAGWTEAQARAYYACKYFEAVEKNALTNLAIQGIQQVLAIYIADKQYEVQKQAQDRLDDQWENQKQKSDIYFNHWNDNARQKEIDLLTKEYNQYIDGYKPNYDAVDNRAFIDVNREYGLAIAKIKREAKAHCGGATRAAVRSMKLAQARANIAIRNQGYRIEENRKDVKEAQYKEIVYKLMGLFRGSITDSLNALRGATAAAIGASKIDPYAGWQQAIGGLDQLGGAINSYRTAGFYAQNGAMPWTDSGGFTQSQSYAGVQNNYSNFGMDGYSGGQLQLNDVNTYSNPAMGGGAGMPPTTGLA